MAPSILTNFGLAVFISTILDAEATMGTVSKPDDFFFTVNAANVVLLKFEIK